MFIAAKIWLVFFLLTLGIGLMVGHLTADKENTGPATKPSALKPLGLKKVA